MGTQLEDLTRRVTEAARAYGGGGNEEMAHELYEVERSLRTAQRRLDRVLRF